MITPEQFKLHSSTSHQICIMVGAKTLCIMDDLDLDLQGHDSDLDPGLRVMSCFAECIFLSLLEETKCGFDLVLVPVCGRQSNRLPGFPRSCDLPLI